MKLFIVFAFVAVVSTVNGASTREQEMTEQEKLGYEMLKQCQNEFGISDESFGKLKTGEITEGSEAERCFMNCFFEKTGLLKDGQLQDDIVTEQFTIRLGEEKAMNAWNSCRGESGPGKCETALKLHNCWIKQGVQ